MLTWHAPRAAQKAALERAFRRHSVLTKAEAVSLAAELSRCTNARGGRLPSVQPAQVHTWFANKRKALNRAARIREEAQAEAAAATQAELLARGIDVSKLPVLPQPLTLALPGPTAASARGVEAAAAAARARSGALLAAAAARTAAEREREREREARAARAAAPRAAALAAAAATAAAATADAEESGLMTLSREPPSTQAAPSHELPASAAAPEPSRRPQRSNAGRRLAEAGGAAAVEAGIASESEDAPPPAPRWALDAALGDGEGAYPSGEPYLGGGAGGRAPAHHNDDDLDGRMRRRLKPYQRVERRLRAGDADALEAFYGVTPAPNVAQRNGIASAMGLTLEQVTTWFKRRQAAPVGGVAPLSVARRASAAGSFAPGDQAAALQRALSLTSVGGGGMERLASRFDSSAAADVAARMLSGGRFGSTTHQP